jgi:hypothetical protein
MISSKNPSFDAGLVAGDGRNRRESAETSNCSRRGFCFDPNFSGQIVENPGHQREGGKEASLWWLGTRRGTAERRRNAAEKPLPEEERGRARERERTGVGFRKWKPTSVNFHIYQNFYHEQ